MRGGGGAAAAPLNRAQPFNLGAAGAATGAAAGGALGSEEFVTSVTATSGMPSFLLAFKAVLAIVARLTSPFSKSLSNRVELGEGPLPGPTVLPPGAASPFLNLLKSLRTK